MSLYDDLGVAVDATSEEVKRAYRRAAKRLHPDGGGSNESFAKIAKAYSVLRDEARRRKYDATGDATEHTPDNAHAEILSTIANHLEVVVTRLSSNADKHDLCSMLVNELGSSKLQISSMIGKTKTALSYWSRIVGRFSNIDSSKPSALDAIVRGRISSLKLDVEEYQRKRKVLDEALAFVATERFTSDMNAAYPMEIWKSPLGLSGFCGTYYGP